MPTIYPVVNYVRKRVYRMGNADIYFKHEIDQILATFTGLNFDTNLVIHKTIQQGVEKHRLQYSTVEARRRHVRRMIVFAAEQIWEGVDPCPVPVCDAETGELLEWRARSTMPTNETFRTFRTRFAPTHKLKDFLFPDYALSDTPGLLPYNSATGWLEDPTMALRKLQEFEEIVTPTWVTDNALNMLTRLAYWRHGEYYRKGRGGFVSRWMSAINNWHIARIEAELKSGAVVRLDYAEAGAYRPRHYRRIHELRIKLGMQQAGTDTMIPLPQHPERAIIVGNKASDDTYRLDILASQADQKRAEGVKHFNKIIRHACVACPVTSFLHYPIGLEGLLEHMRLYHAKSYFTSDDFHLVG